MCLVIANLAWFFITLTAQRPKNILRSAVENFFWSYTRPVNVHVIRVLPVLFSKVATTYIHEIFCNNGIIFCEAITLESVTFIKWKTANQLLDYLRNGAAVLKGIQFVACLGNVTYVLHQVAPRPFMQTPHVTEYSQSILIQHIKSRGAAAWNCLISWCRRRWSLRDTPPLPIG